MSYFPFSLCLKTALGSLWSGTEWRGLGLLKRAGDQTYHCRGTAEQTSAQATESTSTKRHCLKPLSEPSTVFSPAHLKPNNAQNKLVTAWNLTPPDTTLPVLLVWMQLKGPRLNSLCKDHTAWASHPASLPKQRRELGLGQAKASGLRPHLSNGWQGPKHLKKIFTLRVRIRDRRDRRAAAVVPCPDATGQGQPSPKPGGVRSFSWVKQKQKQK